MHLGRLSPCGHVDEPVYISVLPSRLLFSHLPLCRRRHPCCTVLLLSCLISSTPIVCVPRHAFLSTQILFRHILSARVLKAHLVIPHTHGRLPSSYHSLLCLGCFLLRISPGCYTVSIPMHVENGISRPVVCLFCSRPPGCRRRRRHFPSFGYPSAYYSTVMTCTMHTQIMYYYNEE